MRLCRPLVAVLGGLALALTTTGSALAADSTFLWIGPKSKLYALDNPLGAQVSEHGPGGPRRPQRHEEAPGRLHAEELQGDGDPARPR
ncbi:hypothetical protein ACQ4WX_08140 [Streptomyces lasalocidi]